MLALLRRRKSPFGNGYAKICGVASASASPPPPPPPPPPPIEVRLTESAGRGVFATRRIGAGELIHTAKPIVSHPSLSSRDAVCYFCLKKLQKQQNPSFCSHECRQQSNKIFYETEKQADWSAFHEYCRIHGLKYPLMVKRLACMVISGTAAPEILDILQPAKLSSEMIVLMEKEYELLRRTFGDAFAEEQIAFLTMQWYFGVLARIRINSFRIELPLGSYEDMLLAATASVDAQAAVGNAIYMLPSFYNHDCDPNTNILWIESVNAKLKALCDIESGEELRICYIDASMDRDARQAILSGGFGFHCKCARCMSDD